MFNKKQIQTIIKVLKFKGIEGRIALQQVFEQGGFLWATNGYIVLELGEVNDEMKNKRITLQALVGWSETHKAKDTTSLIELAEDNEFQEPDIVKLLHQGYGEPKRFEFHIDLLKLATDYLCVKNFTVIQGISNEHIFMVRPLEKMSQINELMEISAYVMELVNK